MSLAERVQRLFGWFRSGPEDELEDSDMAGNAETRLIVGLGNPGREYAETRHNAGFMVVDALARRWRVGESRKRFKSEIVEYRRNELRVVLQMPQTYMNASGVALREAMNWYKVRPEHVLIVVDDLDQPFGHLRMRARGSAGGHNGLSSIFEQLGSTDVGRLRIGIGRSRAATVTHVLSRFTPDERSQIGEIVADAADAVELWLDRGIAESMNTINGQARSTKEPAAAGNDG